MGCEGRYGARWAFLQGEIREKGGRKSLVTKLKSNRNDMPTCGLILQYRFHCRGKWQGQAQK